MDGSQSQYRCKSCGKVFAPSLVRRNRWGDPCCLGCESPDIAPQRSKLSAAIAAYYLYSIF